VPAARRWYAPVIALARAMRPQQWIKNLTCFAGLLFSLQLQQLAMVLDAVLAFAGFCLVASAVYLFNDFLDRKRDRLSPRTAGRPLASGALPLWLAAISCLILVVTAFMIAAELGRPCVLVMAGYVIMNVAYTIRLKRTVIADVMCIALGFVLRVLFGVYAVQVPPSPWIILCMFFLALFLGFGKRRSELYDLGDAAGSFRPVLRKYNAAYIDMIFGITATLTILTYTLFTVSRQHDPTMTITVIPVVYCVLRYAHQVVVEKAGHSPEMLLWRDKMMWIGVGSWLLLCVSILYFKLHLVEIITL
jgi:4-hydroxybenzoate polyprenyltransferase